MVDDTVVLQRPEVMKLLLAHVLVGRQTQDSIRVLTQTLRLVKSQELEVSALAVLELHFKFDQ